MRVDVVPYESVGLENKAHAPLNEIAHLLASLVHLRTVVSVDVDVHSILPRVSVINSTDLNFNREFVRSRQCLSVRERK